MTSGLVVDVMPTREGMDKSEPGRGLLKDIPTQSLTPMQISVLEAAVQVGYTHGVKAVAIQAEVAPSSVYRWLREDQQFVTAWHCLPALLLRQSRPAIYSALAARAQGGDVAAIKLCLELMRDYIPPAQRVEVSGEVSLSALIVQAHARLNRENDTQTALVDTTPGVLDVVHPMAPPPKSAPHIPDTHAVRKADAGSPDADQPSENIQTGNTGNSPDAVKIDAEDTGAEEAGKPAAPETIVSSNSGGGAMLPPTEETGKPVTGVTDPDPSKAKG